MDTGKAALGVIAGIAAGALLGILFAPAKGSVTRRRILHKGEEYVDDLKEKFEDLIPLCRFCHNKKHITYELTT